MHHGIQETASDHFRQLEKKNMCPGGREDGELKAQSLRKRGDCAYTLREESTEVVG